MLESKDLGGKCADLNALYVGLARAVGLPAHDVYGIRVAKSELEYKSLGPSENVTKAQHCQALRTVDGNGPRSAVPPAHSGRKSAPVPRLLPASPEGPVKLHQTLVFGAASLR